MATHSKSSNKSSIRPQELLNLNCRLQCRNFELGTRLRDSENLLQSAERKNEDLEKKIRTMENQIPRKKVRLRTFPPCFNDVRTPIGTSLLSSSCCNLNDKCFTERRQISDIRSNATSSRVYDEEAAIDEPDVVPVCHCRQDFSRKDNASVLYDRIKDFLKELNHPLIPSAFMSELHSITELETYDGKYQNILNLVRNLPEINRKNLALVILTIQKSLSERGHRYYNRALIEAFNPLLFGHQTADGDNVALEKELVVSALMLSLSIPYWREIIKDEAEIFQFNIKTGKGQ